jgi:hypothetical protein
MQVITPFQGPMDGYIDDHPIALKGRYHPHGA